MAFRKLTLTKYSAYKILWLVSLYKYIKICSNTKKLHWFSIKTTHRLQTVSSYIYKTLQIQQPTHLYNSLSFPPHSLIQDHLIHRFCPSHNYVRTSLGERAFSVIAPRLWNSLPHDTRNSLSGFYIPLKTQNPSFQVSLPP